MTPEQRILLLEERLNKIEKSDRFLFEKTIQLMDGRNIVLGRGTGSMIGTSDDQKIGFLGAAPRGPYNVSFPVQAADLYFLLNSFGLAVHN